MVLARYLLALATLLPIAAAAAAPGAKPVSYERDVRPLLAERCYTCHGNGSRLGALSLETRAA